MNAISLLLPTLAGLVGILLGGLLAGRNQRNQVHAERMIAAADDFATSATAALSAFYTALSRPDTSEEQMGRVERLIPELRGRLTRVVLLFHPDSDTTLTAREAMAHFLVAELEVSLYFNSDDDVQAAEFLQMWDRCNDAHDALEEFLREAARAIRRPGRRRFGPPRDSKVEIGAIERGEQHPARTQSVETA
jgi:hypothetical protein